MTEPVENLFSVLAAVKKVGNPALIGWLETGIEQYLSGDTIENALGLKPSAGQRSARTKFLMQKRNGFLLKAFQMCEAPSAWQQAVLLEREINHYEPLIWSRVKGLDGPPGSHSQLRRNLFFALKCGIGVPARARQLYEICMV